MKDLTRFYDKVDKTVTCWLWRGALQNNGYGRFKLNGKSEMAHRASYEFEHGVIPAGYVVHHKCDTRACVNPAHLQAVTYHDNTMDAIAKGRHHKFRPTEYARGERASQSKLKSHQVRKIKRLPKQGLGYRRLGQQFGVDRTTIRHIIQGKSWRHI